MNILFCGDRNVEDGVFLSTLSLMKNTKRKLDVYVFTMSFKHPKYGCKAMTEAFAKNLEREMKKQNSKHQVHFFDVTDLIHADFPEKNMKTYFTPCCLLRLYADLIPNFPDKVLYLDTDVMANANFDEFYDTDISKYELAGVLDNYGQHFYHYRGLAQKDYLNSGVLLMNIARIRETGLLERCRKLCVDKKMFMPDQTALNKLTNERLILPRKFNEQKEMREDTVFRHFTNTLHFFPVFHVQKIKPWNVERLHSKLRTFEFDDIIDYYQEHVKEVKGR